MKSQKELGAVHLKIEELDLSLFFALVGGKHNMSPKIGFSIKNGGYVENYYRQGEGFTWIQAQEPEDGSKLMTLPELIKFNMPRTEADIKEEIAQLHAELKDLHKIKVGDFVYTDSGVFGIVDRIDTSSHPYLVGNHCCKGVTKVNEHMTLAQLAKRPSK